MNKSRVKLFIENFFVYGLGSVISKIIPLIMLPFITSIMKDSKYYGINDMVNLVISFSTAIAIMGMYDAMFRMFFEKQDEKFRKGVCSTALFFVIISSLIMCSILAVFKNEIMLLVVEDIKYNNLFYIIILNTFFGTFLNIISAPTRMQNKRKIFLMTNTITPILSYGISIPMILRGEFIYALPLASVISTITMSLIFYILNKKWFSVKLISINYFRDMLKIGLPLMPTFIIFWLCNSLDRIMIKYIVGLNELGIYSVASKIAQISQLIYAAVGMGWQYFAFSTMNDEDQKDLITSAIEYILAICIVLTIMITTFSKSIFILLAKGNYSDGYILLPYLFLSPLLLLIFQITCSQFVIKKKTYPILLTLILGVIINIGINYIVIPILGIEGAAIATMTGYIVSVVIILVLCKKINLVNKVKRIFVLIVYLCTYLIVWRMFLCDNILKSVSSGVLCIIICIYVYIKEIKNIYELIFKK